MVFLLVELVLAQFCSAPRKKRKKKKRGVAQRRRRVLKLLEERGLLVYTVDKKGGDKSFLSSAVTSVALEL